ncbi:MAG TPA: hypothetical protein VD835_08670 [Pyrinomonadaceae bacterium]|nr:hypothetical protein [Pyrinomonadaceae bacterium]
MSTVLEYSYEENTRHLDDSEALEKYKREKAVNPDALIVLDDLRCGHWEVEVYKTPQEKENFLRKRLAELWDDFFSPFKK